MRVYQLFYTSCKKGLSSGMGFQTYSMSEGLSREEAEEIEGHCIYIPPDNLSGNPTDEEITKLYPISFSFFKLKSGKNCLCRIKYSGKDYSGRFGNYFCHVLIIDEHELPFYPIEFYESPIFRDGLTEEEKNSEVIVPLPVLYEIPKGNITLEKIELFLKGGAAKKRTKSLNVFLDGIIDGEINRKKIFFCDEKSNLALWIAAATMTLPVSQANLITFNTYSFDAENNTEFICGSLKEGTRVDFSKAKGAYKYNLFNFQDGSNNEFSFKSKFAKQASLEYTLVKDYREALINFMKLFDYKRIDDNIDNCVNLLNLVNNGLERISDEDAVKSIDFANKYAYASASALEQIMLRLNDNTLNKITTKLNLNLADVIFKFLFRTAKLTGRKEYMDKAYEFFFNSLLYMLENSKTIEISDIIKLHNDIRDYNSDNIANFISKSIERERLERITTYLENGTPRHAQYYLCTIIGDFMNSKDSEFHAVKWKSFGNSGYFPIFIEKALSMLIDFRDEMKFVLSYVYMEKSYFINIVLISYKIALNRKREILIVSLLSEYLSQITLGEAIQIRKELFQIESGSKILIDVYRYELSKHESKKEYFKNYCLEIFDENSKYRDKCFNLAAEELLLYYSNSNFNMEEFIWFFDYVKKRRLHRKFTNSLADKIVEIFQGIIPIKILDRSTVMLITDIEDIRKSYYVNIRPNIAEVVLAINKLCYFDIPKFLDDEHQFQFEGIEAEKYEEILKLAFKIICPYLKGEIDHVHLKRIFQYDKHFEIYLKAYIEIITDIFIEMKGSKQEVNYNIKSPYEIYLDSIYYLLKSGKTFSDEQKKAVSNSIIENLKSIEKAELNNYNSYMKVRISNTSIHKEAVRIREQWDEIYEGVLSERKKRKSLFDKMQDIYKH